MFTYTAQPTCVIVTKFTSGIGQGLRHQSLTTHSARATSSPENFTQGEAPRTHAPLLPFRPDLYFRCVGTPRALAHQGLQCCAQWRAAQVCTSTPLGRRCRQACATHAGAHAFCYICTMMKLPKNVFLRRQPCHEAICEYMSQNTYSI